MRTHLQDKHDADCLPDGVTVIVAAHNEQEQLFNSVCNIIEGALLARLAAYEIIIIDDGSTDNTWSIAQQLTGRSSAIRAIRHDRCQGLGAVFIHGVEAARYAKVTLFAGDNNAHASLAEALFRNRDMADVVISYFLNVEHRTRFRVLLSALFTAVYNGVFGLHLKYINGNSLYPVGLIRELNLQDSSYGISSEVLVKCLRRGVSFYEVAGYANPDGTKSQALTLKNFGRVAWGFLRLLWTVYCAEKQKYSHHPRRAHVPPYRVHSVVPGGKTEADATAAEDN